MAWGDCWVTEMMRELPMETVFEITHWFGKRFRWGAGRPQGGKLLRKVGEWREREGRKVLGIREMAVNPLGIP